MNAACPFCSLEDLSSVVYQDGHCFALISRQPINPFHTLVVPKTHHERFTDLPDELASHLFLVAKRISKAVALLSEADFITHLSDDDLKETGTNLVSHYKLHIIPRYLKDKVVIDWHREEDAENRRQRDYAEKLRGRLS